MKTIEEIKGIGGTIEADTLMKKMTVIIENAGDGLFSYILFTDISTQCKNISDVENSIRDAIDMYLKDCPYTTDITSNEFELDFHIDEISFMRPQTRFYEYKNHSRQSRKRKFMTGQIGLIRRNLASVMRKAGVIILKKSAEMMQ